MSSRRAVLCGGDGLLATGVSRAWSCSPTACAIPTRWRWLDRLTDAEETLEDAGFGVPDAYPESCEIRTPKRRDR